MLDPIRMFLKKSVPYFTENHGHVDSAIYPEVILDNVSQGCDREAVLNLVFDLGLDSPDDQASKDYKALITLYEEFKEKLHSL